MISKKTMIWIAVGVIAFIIIIAGGLFLSNRLFEAIYISSQNGGGSAEAPFKPVEPIKESDLLKKHHITWRKITFSDSSTYTMEYFNENGLPTKEITYYDNEKKTTRTVTYKYNASNKLIEQVGIEANELQFHTVYQYESDLLVKEIEKKDGAVTTYRYDEQNRLAMKIEPKFITEYLYDEHSLLTCEVVYERGEDGPGGEPYVSNDGTAVHYAYNDKGWKVSSSSKDPDYGKEETQWEYDEVGRVVYQKSAFGTFKQELRSYYNKMGLIERKVSKIAGISINYEYFTN